MVDRYYVAIPVCKTLQMRETVRHSRHQVKGKSGFLTPSLRSVQRQMLPRSAPTPSSESFLSVRFFAYSESERQKALTKGKEHRTWLQLVWGL